MRKKGLFLLSLHQLFSFQHPTLAHLTVTDFQWEFILAEPIDKTSIYLNVSNAVMKRRCNISLNINIYILIVSSFMVVYTAYIDKQFDFCIAFCLI